MPFHAGKLRDQGQNTNNVQEKLTTTSSLEHGSQQKWIDHGDRLKIPDFQTQRKEPRNEHSCGPKTRFRAIKAKQNLARASGDYAVIGTTLQIVGEKLAERLDLVPGASVVDVAAGNSNASLAFARRFHNVISTGYVPDLLENGKARAKSDATHISFQIADAEALPFRDGAFDAAVSTFGVMFAPKQERAAQELLRVTRKGGLIGLANWAPSGFIGQLFTTLDGRVTPPAGVKSPAL